MHCEERGYEPTAVAARARWKCASASPRRTATSWYCRSVYFLECQLKCTNDILNRLSWKPGVGKLSEKHIGPCHLQICSLKKQNWSAEMWLEKWPLRSDICLQRIVSVVSSMHMVIFSQFKRCFAIIWGKKSASVQSKSSLRSFWNWAFVLTTATVA
jgi:hypothetical protein